MSVLRNGKELSGERDHNEGEKAGRGEDHHREKHESRMENDPLWKDPAFFTR